MTLPSPSGNQRGKVPSSKGYLLVCEWCGDLGFAKRAHARHCCKDCQLKSLKHLRRLAGLA